MKGSDELFQLIKTMDKAEKRYFRLSAAMQKGDKNYLALFDDMERMQEYDEQALLATGRPYVRQFPSEKHYLYGTLLKCLHRYHNNMNSGMERMLHCAGILMDRGLLRQSGKMLAKAKESAYRYESHQWMLAALQTEKDLAYEEFDLEKLARAPETLREEKRVLRAYENLCEYRELVSWVFVVIRKNIALHGKKEIGQFRRVIRHPLLENEKRSLSPMAQIYRVHVLHVYNYTQRNFRNSYRYSSRALQILESHPHLISEKPRNYTIAMQNLLMDQLNLGLLDEFRSTLEKFRSFRPSSPKLQSDVFINTCNMELIMYISTGEFEKGARLSKDFEMELKKRERNVNKIAEILFSYYSFLLYFILGDYDKAQERLTGILNEPALSLAVDIHCYSKIMNLILHYELQNEDLLEYAVRSTYRFLYKRNLLNQFEKCMLRFIGRKLPRMRTPVEITGSFKELKSDLLEIFKDPREQVALEYFDYIAWLDSKISGRPLKEVVKNKSVKS